MSPNPIRILMLFTIMNRGGAETMTMNYLRKIDRTKVIFDFLVRRREKGAYDDEIERLGGRIHRLKMSSPTEISRFFDRHPEYTMVHGHCSELGWLVYREAHRRGFDFIAAHAHNSPRGFDAKSPVRHLLKHAMRPHLTHCFTCGDDAARWLFGPRLSKEAVFLPNAVDTAALAFDPAARAAVRRTHVWDGRTVVGHVGRFSAQKNHRLLLDIFAHLRHLDPTALLVLIGGGGQTERRTRERVKRLGLTGHVRFMGIRTDIARLLQGIDVFLFPSRFEGLSVAMLEAQAAGLPVVCSDGIPRQGIVLPDLVTSLPLTAAPATWAGHVLRAAHTDSRTDRRAAMTAAGFDIDNNSQWLQKFYTAQSRPR